ncbi:MAG: hypothetical protein ACI9ZH_001545, partial [Paracoccaceae bacterium]
ATAREDRIETAGADRGDRHEGRREAPSMRSAPERFLTRGH